MKFLLLPCVSLCWAVQAAEPAVKLGFDSEAALLRDDGASQTAFRTQGTVLFDENGVKGGCAYFDGKSWLEATAFPAALKTGASPYAVSAWIRLADGGSPKGGWVSWGDKANGCGNSLRLNGFDGIHNYWNNRDLSVRVPDLADSRWHYVTATYDGKRRAVYVDGLACGDDEQTANVGRTLFQVGRTMHDVPFKGWVDELRVDNAPVTAAAAFELYRAALTPAALARTKPLPPTAVLRRKPVTATAEQVLADGFTATLQIDLSKPVTEEELLYTVGPVRLVLRQAGKDKALADYDTRFGNYLNWPLKDGTCPVLEATIAAKATQVGIPLGFLAKPEGVHTVTLNFAPVRWTICVDGHVDEAFPVPACPVVWPTATEEKVCSVRVKDAAFVSPARKDALPPVPQARTIAEPIQYWTPQDHNTWVGDVAPAFLNGKLHVFYLIDRRHHTSGLGTGRHQFAHLTSDDLVHWVEHPLAVSIREVWQTCGTGTPFLKDGKVAIAFGWHTARYPQCKGKPIGGTYAYSDDGINFKNAGVMISDAQNPSIYNLDDGRYELVTSYGGSIGIFHSRDLLKWDLFDDKLPFRGDCPSLFDLNGRRYLLQGFTNMAYSPDGKPGSFVNWTDEPDILYEGLCVPMVAKWKDNRRLYIGWLNHLYGWGGWLVFREVVAYPDGHLGLKWVPEIASPTKPREYAVKGGERFQLRLTPEKGGAALVFTVDPSVKEASFCDDVPGVKLQKPRYGGNFKIGGVRGVDQDYAVKLIVHYDAKADATIFDAEIAGQRTLICRRPGRYK